MKKIVFHKIRRFWYDPALIIIWIAISIILWTWAVASSINIIDFFQKQADESRLSILTNAVMMWINRDWDISIKCSDWTATGCIISDWGTYDWCSMTGVNFEKSFKSGDNLSTIILNSSWSITNITDFNYILCPKLANWVAYSGTLVNPSFYLRANNWKSFERINFNP